MNNIASLSLVETLAGLKEKKFSEKELNQAYFKRIGLLEEKLEVFLEVLNNSKGIPVAVKDNISTKDIKTTAASKILESYIPPYNATVIDRLLAHNGSIIGKTNCDEFAMGSSGENSVYKITKNPWDITKVPGGSSSGSAVAVAADMAVFSLGSDTGGSIRQPASFCGVTGFKPSYGSVSRYGLLAMASSLDQIGPIAKSVEDIRLIMEWISGSDNKDSNYNDSSLHPWGGATNIKGIKIGLPKEYFSKGLDIEVEKVIRETISKLEGLGAEVVDVDLPNTQYAIAAYYIIMASEVSSNLARFDGIRFGGTRDLFGEEVKRRIMLGTFALSTGYYDDYFIKAAKVRTLVKKDFEKAFDKCDVIVGPVSPTTAWNIGEKVSDPLSMYLSDIYTVPASLAGLPGLSVPAGFVNGLPVGLQILGKYRGDKTVLDVGEVFQNNTDWHKQKPVITMSSRT